MSVSLAKPVDLTNTRAVAAGAMLAYANESLQAVKNFNADANSASYVNVCIYEGPCAIGVSIEPATRRIWDARDGQSIWSILNDGLAIGDDEALSTLQQVHDHFAGSPWSEAAHFNFLIVTTFYAMGLHE